MIRIGVYGLGKISYRVIQGILYANNADLYAVCSSNLEKANAFKEEYIGQERLTIAMKRCYRMQI